VRSKKEAKSWDLGKQAVKRVGKILSRLSIKKKGGVGGYKTGYIGYEEKQERNSRTING